VGQAHSVGRAVGAENTSTLSAVVLIETTERARARGRGRERERETERERERQRE
jgi:hypothetical protein